MRSLLGMAVLLVLAGLGVLGYAAILGQVQVVLFLVFPMIVGSGPLAFLGGVLLTAGIFAGFWALTGGTLTRGMSWQWPPPATDAARAEPKEAPRGRSGGFILLGPIPIAWGSTRGVAVTMLVLAIIVLVLAVLLLPILLPRLLRGAP